MIPSSAFGAFKLPQNLRMAPKGCPDRDILGPGQDLRNR
jgi:hypothetical protein